MSDDATTPSKLDEHLQAIEENQAVKPSTKVAIVGSSLAVGGVSAALNVGGAMYATRAVQTFRRYVDAVSAWVEQHKTKSPHTFIEEATVDDIMAAKTAKAFGIDGNPKINAEEAMGAYTKAKETLNNITDSKKIKTHLWPEAKVFMRNNKLVTAALGALGLFSGLQVGMASYSATRDAQDQAIGENFRRAVAESGVEYAETVKAAGKDSPEARVIGKWTEHVEPDVKAQAESAGMSL